MRATFLNGQKIRVLNFLYTLVMLVILQCWLQIVQQYHKYYHVLSSQLDSLFPGIMTYALITHIKCIKNSYNF